MATTNERKYPGAATVTGTVTASLTGNVTGNATGSSTNAGNAASAANAGSATTATYAADAGAAATVAFTDRDSNNENNYVAFVANHTAGNKALRTDSGLYYNPWSAYLNANVPSTTNATNIGGLAVNDTGTANTIAARTATNADLYARLFRSHYGNQNTISGAIAYRVSANDNYIRFCNNIPKIREYLDVPSTSGGDVADKANNSAWSITVNGSAANATYATSAGFANTVAYATDALNSTNANAANTVAFTDRDSSDTTDYIAFVDTHASGDKALYTDINLTYNSSNGYINANAGTANNATTLSGLSPSMNATANTIAQRDASGHLSMVYGFSSYLNMSHGAGTRNGDTVFYSSYDNYIRKNTKSGMRSSLSLPTRTGGDASGTWSINVNGYVSSLKTTMSGTIYSTGSENFSTSAYSHGAQYYYTLFHGGFSYWQWNDDAPGYGNPTNRSVSARVERSIVSGGDMYRHSDLRIKDDITTIDTNYALSKLNKLRPVSYTRKDNRDFDYGFIAQEVEEELPEMVGISDGFIGDICVFGKFSGKRLLGSEEMQTLKNTRDEIVKEAEIEYPSHMLNDDIFEGNVYQYTITTLSPLPESYDTSRPFVLRIEVKGPEDTIRFTNRFEVLYNPKICGEIEGDSVIKVLIFESDNGYRYINEDEMYRLYGRYTTDIKTLEGDKQMISMITASVQEIDKQRIQSKTKINELETKYEELSKTLSELKTN